MSYINTTKWTTLKSNYLVKINVILSSMTKEFLNFKNYLINNQMESFGLIKKEIKKYSNKSITTEVSAYS